MSATTADSQPTANAEDGATVPEMLAAVDAARTVSFDLGRLFITPGARDALAALGVSPQTFLDRHRRGEWGDLTEGDRLLNDAALLDGSRIFSGYTVEGLPGGKVWVITEAADDDGERVATTVLLPSEY
jgi:hypothetical protein